MENAASSSNTTTVSVRLPKPTATKEQLPQQQQQDGLDGWKQPCIVAAMYGAISTGVLGFFFGFMPSMLRNRSFKLWRNWTADGVQSAQALALMTGVYSTVQCICSRLRMVEDGWNRGVAGCSTGLLLGWKGGPASAAQSCLGLGLISYIIDFDKAGEQPPAKACCLACSSSPRSSATPSSSSSSCCTFLANNHSAELLGTPSSTPSSAAPGSRTGMVPAALQRRWQPQAQQPAHQLGLPPVMWLGSVLQPNYFHA